MPTKNIDPQEQALKDYDRESQSILKQMLLVLMRAQRKVDDKAYLMTLQKLETHKQK